VGDHRAHHSALRTPEANRNWPIVVRRAQATDRAAVLAFATRTWDGWDYIPHAWPVWLAADDGVLLVATVGPTADGSPARDADGQPLAHGDPIAISRVALLSSTEGWVEGIRVDPRVRGLGVATDLQTAELHWLTAHEPLITRYATSARNEGSHRLGARHGFELVARFVSWTWRDPARPDDEEREETGFDEPTRQAANRRRRDLLSRLDADGLILHASAGAEWWSRLDADARFAAGGRLYERRSWTVQELTEQLFTAHVAAGEVVIKRGAGWGVAIVGRDVEPAEDAGIHLAVIAGDSVGLADIAAHVQRIAGERIRFRLEADSIPAEVAAGLNAAGFEAWQWELHILSRPGPSAAPPVEPPRLVLAEKPRRVIRPPAGGT
jgi:GNAT superfamily N-acetyltransferase